MTDVTKATHQALQMEMSSGDLPAVRFSEPAGDADAVAGLALPQVWVIDAPVLPDASGDEGPLLAGLGEPWPGPVTVSAGFDATELSPRAELVEAAGVGRTLQAFARGPLGRWDDSATLYVEMPGEVLTSRSALAALGGDGALLVQNATGWEMLVYRDAELMGAGQYRLTGLLRGLQGSQILDVDAGAMCVRLDERLARGLVRREEVGLELVWQGEGRGLFGPLLDDMFENKAGLGFSPAHLRVEMGADRVRRAAWIRRGADIRDNWVGPAAENTGRFAVDVLRNGSAIVSAIAQTPAWTLPGEVAAGDVLQVREIGADGRAGWPAQLVL